MSRGLPGAAVHSGADGLRVVPVEDAGRHEQLRAAVRAPPVQLLFCRLASLSLEAKGVCVGGGAQTAAPASTPGSGPSLCYGDPGQSQRGCWSAWGLLGDLPRRPPVRPPVPLPQTARGRGCSFVGPSPEEC